MALSKEVIWQQVFPEDAESRIQQAFEMLLWDEFGLTDYARLGAAVDQRSCKDYNQDDETPTIKPKGNCQSVKSIQKVNSTVFKGLGY